MTHAASPEPLVPAPVVIAAKRGFLRTTAQAYAATIPTGGVAVGSIVALIQDPDPVIIIATAGAAILSPILAGSASALAILSAGVPVEYTAATVTPVESTLDT